MGKPHLIRRLVSHLNGSQELFFKTMEESKGGAASAYRTSAGCPAPIMVSVLVLLHCVLWLPHVPLWLAPVLCELYPEESWEHSCLHLDFKGWGPQAELRAWVSSPGELSGPRTQLPQGRAAESCGCLACAWQSCRGRATTQ